MRLIVAQKSKESEKGGDSMDLIKIIDIIIFCNPLIFGMYSNSKNLNLNFLSFC